jgi:beta-lactamase superfamily II metal-dependent hydrolase
VAVFSFGRNNGFGFPHPGVLERLKDRGIRWLTTARNGGIRIISRKRGLEIEVSR